MRHKGVLVFGAVLVLAMLVYLLTDAGIIGMRQRETLDQRLLEISSQLHPPGDNMPMTVVSSTVPTAWIIRRQIIVMLDKGMSNQVTLRTLENDYGPTVLANPPKYGFGLMAWVLPAVGVLIAGGAGVLLDRKISKRESGSFTESGVTGDIPSETFEKEWREYL